MSLGSLGFGVESFGFGVEGVRVQGLRVAGTVVFSASDLSANYGMCSGFEAHGSGSRLKALRIQDMGGLG